MEVIKARACGDMKIDWKVAQEARGWIGKMYQLIWSAFSLSPWRERVRVRGKNNRHPHLYPLPSRERK